MLEWVHHALVAGTPVWLMLSATFVAALLIPFGAEAAVMAIVGFRPELYWPAILIAAGGHTIACMAGFALGYLAHRALRRHEEKRARYGPWVERYGPASMLLTGVPGVGDPYAVVAGWFRLAPMPSTLYCAAGKLTRFLVVGTSVTLLPVG